jgi:N-acetylmuramoyl-L-alanine amidase
MAAVGLMGAVLAGCNGKKAPHGQSPDLSGGLITVTEMARRLNLRVTQAGAVTASLRDSHNYVTVCGNPRSRVFVNGQELPGRDQIVSSKSGLLIDEDLVLQVRSLLRGPAPRPQPSDQETPIPSPPGSAVLGTVVIDPGHGGDDPGARKSGLVEKDLVLDVALELAGLLEQQGARVVLTRRDDRFLELEDRAEIANRAQADLFISLHADSAPRNRSAEGFTAWIARSASREAAAAASTLCRRFEAAGLACRGTRQADYRVLVLTRCPAVLAEIGFLSNASEARRLKQASYRSRVAAALADGIVNHLGRAAGR